jgi:hypothetical protein
MLRINDNEAVRACSQDDVLVPLLFNIFINDLNGVISESSLPLYESSLPQANGPRVLAE